MAEKPIEGFKHIVRVANVDLPGNKAIRFSLSKIKGVGVNFADAACTVANVKRELKAGNLTPDQIGRLTAILTNPAHYGIPPWMFNHRKDLETGEHKHLLSGVLQFTQENDLKRLKKIRSYRGIRHMHGLTVRGQRTKSNFRKMKGKVVAVAKKKEAAPAEAKAAAPVKGKK